MIDRQDIRWLAIAILVVLVIVQAPYVLAFLIAPPDSEFSGSLFYLLDSNSYLAMIRQGTAGSWLFYDLYTPEPHQPVPIYTFYIAWGHLGAALGVPPTVTLALARLVQGFVLLVTLYWFLTLLLPERSQRRTAFLLLAFASGIGWLLVPFGGNTVLGDTAPDFWMPEVNTFLTLLIPPHFAAATSLMLLVFGGLLLAFREGRLTPALGAALSAFLLAWIHPFVLVPVYAVAACYLAWQGVRLRGVPWQSVGHLALCVIPSVMAVAYLQFGVIAPNAVFQGWMGQNIMASPNVLAYLVGFGLLVPLALAGAIHGIRRRNRLDPFPLFWIVVGSLLLYAPLAVQRRLAEGLQIPLGVLAALGWLEFRRVLQGRMLPSAFLTAILVAGLMGSTLLTLSSAVTRILDRDPSVFIPNYEVEAMTWLEEKSDWRDTVLSSYRSGSYIPVWAGNRVVIGHSVQTIRRGEKELDIQRFFAAGTDGEVRREITRRYQVRYLYYGPYERSLGDYDPGSDPGWEQVFANEGVTVYRSTLAP